MSCCPLCLVNFLVSHTRNPSRPINASAIGNPRPRPTPRPICRDIESAVEVCVDVDIGGEVGSLKVGGYEVGIDVDIDDEVVVARMNEETAFRMMVPTGTLDQDD